MVYPIQTGIEDIASKESQHLTNHAIIESVP